MSEVSATKAIMWSNRILSQLKDIEVLVAALHEDIEAFITASERQRRKR